MIAAGFCMSGLHPTFHVDMLMVLLLVASSVAMVLKWIRLPYSIALVIVGLFIGVFHILPPVEMTPDLILLIFLPALLFEASWNIDFHALKKNGLLIGVFATVGVVISMLVIAAVLHFWGGLPPAIALLVGAMISPTDPISVLALFRKMGMERRLSLILEGESLINDGTAAVLFKLVLAIVVSGVAYELPWALPQTAGEFLTAVAGGVFIGLVLGYGASRLTSYFDDHLLEITLTTIVAYGSFLVAEHLVVSPVIAVVTAGIVLGNWGSRTGMSATTRLAVSSFWEYAAFVVNSLVFLLIGLQVKLELLDRYKELILVGIVAIFIARALVVYGLAPFVSSKLRPLPWKWRHLLVWGALRGSLSMALALSLPLDFPMREAIIIVTFGVVLFTLLVQGLTIEPLVKLFKITPSYLPLLAYEQLRATSMSEDRALEALESLRGSKSISTPVYSRLRSDLEKRRHALQNRIDELQLADASLEALQVTQARMHLLEARKDCLQRLARDEVVRREIVNKLMIDLDSQLDELREQHEAVAAMPTV